MDLLDHLSKLLPDIVSPLGLVLSLLLVSLLLRKRHKLRTAASLLAVVVLVFFSLPLTSNFLVATLENRYPPIPIAQLPESDVLVLLGGSVKLPMAGMERAELGPSGDRLALTSSIYKAGKVKKILISAGNLFRPDHLESEAEYTAKILSEWGIPRHDMILEEESGNTYENALYTKQLLKSEEADSVLLVTSSLHMPRARALFCAAGVNTLGVTANHWNTMANPISKSNWFPQAVSFRSSSRVIREYMGIVVYGLTKNLDTKALNHDQPCSLNQL